MRINAGLFVIVLCIAGLFLHCSDSRPPAIDQEPVSELEQINAAISRDPDRAHNYVLRAQWHHQRGNYGDAIIDMAEAMKRDSVNEAYHLFLAEIYMKSARSQYALGTLERAAMLFPDSISTFLRIAQYNLVVRQYDKASEALRRAMTLDPQNVTALHLLGIMYREREESDRAIQTYQTIVELDSEDAEAWTALGNLLDARGDPVALRCFDNAIKANPEYVQGWHSKAYYLQNHGQIPAAIAIYRHIHSIDSLYADAWLNRGILYLETDSLAESEDCFRWLMALDTLSPLAFYYAGVVAQQMGKTEVARNHLHKALALAPGSPRVQEAIDQLR